MATSTEIATSAEIATSTEIATWHQKTRLIQIEAIGYNSAFSSDALSLMLEHINVGPKFYYYMQRYYRAYIYAHMPGYEIG